MSDENVNIEPIIETENYSVIRVTGGEDGTIYHVELPNLTLYFFEEEWHEFANMIQEAIGE